MFVIWVVQTNSIGEWFGFWMSSEYQEKALIPFLFRELIHISLPLSEICCLWNCKYSALTTQPPWPRKKFGLWMIPPFVWYSYESGFWEFDIQIPTVIPSTNKHRLSNILMNSHLNKRSFIFKWKKRIKDVYKCTKKYFKTVNKNMNEWINELMNERMKRNPCILSMCSKLYKK